MDDCLLSQVAESLCETHSGPRHIAQRGHPSSPGVASGRAEDCKVITLKSFGRELKSPSTDIFSRKSHHSAFLSRVCFYCFCLVGRFTITPTRYDSVSTGVCSVGWPSGLRRQFKALVSSEAWVRIPLQSFFFFRVRPALYQPRGGGWSEGSPVSAFIALLGERQTEDLKVPSSILGEGKFFCTNFFVPPCKGATARRSHTSPIV